MNELFLIFIVKIGKTHKRDMMYEFIFSDTIENIDGEDWDTYPASGRPQAPNDNFIKKVGRLEADLNLDVVQESDTFAVWDAIDGVIALGWENINEYDQYPKRRLCFKFGETIKNVEEKLYEKDLTLKYSKSSKNEK